MQIIEWIASYGAWSWVVAGVILLALELVVPGGFFLWIGISGVVTGLAVLIWPGISWPFQFLTFGVLALVTIFAWLTYRRGRPQVTDKPFLNERAATIVGREFMLEEPIHNGYGRVPIGDSHWRVAGPDLAAGRKVKVIGYDGPLLKVEAAQ